MTNTLLGTWKLNVDKSTADPGPLVRSETRAYEAVGDDGLKLVVQGSDAIEAAYSYSVTGKIDGRDYPLAGSGTRTGADTTSWKRIDPYLIESAVKKAGKVVKSVRLEVSKDGRVLTLSEHGTNPSGRPTRGVRVYDRQ